MASSSSRPTRPLNVGNAVSASISLLRSNFTTYIGLSAKATLWWFVPVYGWARALMIYGQMSRLGFHEMAHKPEPVQAAWREVRPRMWAFLGVGILVFLILMAVSIAISVVTLPLNIVIGIIALAGDVGFALSNLLSLLLQLVLVVVSMWFQARFLLYNAILGVETEIDSTSSIARGWQLTKGSEFRMLLVILVANLVTFPLYLLTAVVVGALTFLVYLIASPVLSPFFMGVFEGIQAPTLTGETLGGLFIIFLLFFALLILVAALTGIVTQPFWRSLMAVLYYDLRSRREGLDIQLGKPPQDRQSP